LTGLTSQTLPASVYVNPQHVDTLLDLHEVLAQAIDTLRNDRESTAVSRARALAYCCGVDARLIEIARVAELQQPKQGEDQETELELEAEYDAAQDVIFDDPVTHDQYCEWVGYRVRYLHHHDPESEAALRAATSDLVSKASKTARELNGIYADALRRRAAKTRRPERRGGVQRRLSVKLSLKAVGSMAAAELISLSRLAPREDIDSGAVLHMLIGAISDPSGYTAIGDQSIVSCDVDLRTKLIDLSSD